MGIFFQHFVCESHQVVVINGAVFAPDIGKLVAPGGRAPRIAEEDEAAGAGHDLHFMHKAGAVVGAGAAVDFQSAGVFLVFVVVHGQQHKAVDAHAVLIGERQRLRLGHILILEEIAVEIAQLNLLAGSGVHLVNLVELRVF